MCNRPGSNCLARGGMVIRPTIQLRGPRRTDRQRPQGIVPKIIEIIRILAHFGRTDMGGYKQWIPMHSTRSYNARGRSCVGPFSELRTRQAFSPEPRTRDGSPTKAAAALSVCHLEYDCLAYLNLPDMFR